MFEKIRTSWKYVKFKDLFAIFIFIVALPFALFFKLINKIKKRTLYLICESPDTARDNGYHLYKFIRENYPQEYCFYAINKKGSDFKRIEKYDNIIEYNSFKHWVYYLAANINISTQKSGNPNPPLFYVLQVYGIWKNKRVFLQHGMVINDAPWLYYKETKFRLFLCSGNEEIKFVQKKFGYPKENIVLTGLARYDKLEIKNPNSKQILLMPTWREWIGTETNILNKTDKFIDTLYYKKYQSLINNSKLLKYLEIQNIKLYFYPHLNMQKFNDKFGSNSKNVKIVSNEDIDIQELLISSSLMITDYSSVCMDFSYMRKPVIYYQFDQDEFRKKQYDEGYFKYNKNGFGDCLYTENEVVDKIIEYVENNYKLEEKYDRRIENFYTYKDKNNCERIYKEILKIR